MKFIEITHTNNQKSLKATDFFLLRVWDIFCAKHTKNLKLSANAIRALLQVDLATKLTGISINCSNELTWAFDDGTPGAAIFPECYQPWESDLISLCTKNERGLFSLTFEGESMKDLLMREINKMYLAELESISSNQYIHILEL